jgi:sugar/nucleoside kinase (ribokinase family)
MEIDERHERREKERHPKPAFRLGDEGRPDHSLQSYPLAPERRYSSRAPLEFLAVGHVTIDTDTINERQRVGGAAVYAALTARYLGLKSGIVTSAGADFPFWDALSGIETHSITTKTTTAFENDYAEGTRRQRVRALAEPIRAHHLSAIQLAADAAVLYCPVVHEIEAPLVRLAPGGLCGVAPQGFFRQWDGTGIVSIREWVEASSALSGADFVCMSEEDAFVPEELAEEFSGRAFAITRAERGCRVYAGADIYDFPAAPAEPADVIDPTGAGDVFAAAFLVALRNAKPLPHATTFASQVAAKAVTSEGISWLL